MTTTAPRAVLTRRRVVPVLTVAAIAAGLSCAVLALRDAMKGLGE